MRILFVLCGEECISDNEHNGVHTQETDSGRVLFSGQEELTELPQGLKEEGEALVATAAHAVFCLKFGGPGKKTLWFIYRYAFEFKVDVGEYGRRLYKKTQRRVEQLRGVTWTKRKAQVRWAMGNIRC